MPRSSPRRQHRCRISSLTLVVAMATLVVWVTIVTYITTYSSLPSDSKLDLNTGVFQKLSAKAEKLALLCNGVNGSLRQDGNMTVVPGWHLQQLKQPKLLKNFKNPCFFQNVPTRTNPELNSTKVDMQQSLRCLPYFIVAGFPKAGTTDLWFRLLNHPDIAARHVKEPMFFNNGRYEYQSFGAAAEQYIDFFSKAAKILERLVSPAACHGTFPYHHGITGEASVDTAFDNARWQQLPGNGGCKEPIVTNADYVYRINPDIKVIFLVRNPIERLYSDYIYEARFFQYTTHPKDFHDAVVQTIRNFTECTGHHTTRACAYNSSVDTHKVRLRVGLYHVFIADWLDVFPKENILVVKSEDLLGTNKFPTYRKLCRFLDIRPFTHLEEVTIFYRGPINTRSLPEKDVGDMWPDTKRILHEFYKPFSQKLSEMLPHIDYNDMSGVK